MIDSNVVPMRVCWDNMPIPEDLRTQIDCLIGERYTFPRELAVLHIDQINLSYDEELEIDVWFEGVQSIERGLCVSIQIAFAQNPETGLLFVKTDSVIQVDSNTYPITAHPFALPSSVTYRGWLRLGSNGEEDELLCLSHLSDKWVDAPFLAEVIADDVEQYSNMVSVRYFVSDVEASEDVLQEQFTTLYMGVAEAEYHVAYSEWTGYLWTDENLVIGGHDLLEELKSCVGKFLHMVVTYHE